VTLICVSLAVAAARTKLYQTNSFQESIAVPFTGANDSICKSMIETQGYVCQEHKVTTEDGYILGIQRIPTGRSGKRADKPPVLLQHGLFSDSVVWLFNSPEESLAFILADNGFDVWLANSRGTKSSLQHKTLAPNDPAYWEWSWDELAAYDLPAIFKYVHDQTGQKLHYVGHSLGTTIALAAFSQDKLLNMLRSAALLCPIAHLDHMESQLAKIAAENFLAEDLYWLGLREFVPKGQEVAKLLEKICNAPGIDCSNLLTAFTGPNCCVNSSRIDVYLENEPQSTSTKNMIHLAQMIRTGSIAKYDYGNEEGNMNHYGQTTPPVYNMTAIPNDLPLYISNGGQDTLSDVKDVQVLLDDLNHHHKDKLVVQYRDQYAHADFVMGVNANQVVYDPLMAFFSQR
jgi:lysosomal acid lipase/cholesteryl ester hydrolase